MPNSMIIYCDGLCQPKNPGGCGAWGWVAYEAGVFPTAEAYGYQALGETWGDQAMTNNVAEYHAVIGALAWALENGRLGILIRTDSQIVVGQVNGTMACNKPHLQELRDYTRTLRDATQARLAWIPGESNEAADKLSRRAYREWRRTRSTEPVVRERAAA